MVITELCVRMLKREVSSFGRSRDQCLKKWVKKSVRHATLLMLLHFGYSSHINYWFQTKVFVSSDACPPRLMILSEAHFRETENPRYLKALKIAEAGKRSSQVVIANPFDFWASANTLWWWMFNGRGWRQRIFCIFLRGDSWLIRKVFWLDKLRNEAWIRFVFKVLKVCLIIIFLYSHLSTNKKATKSKRQRMTIRKTIQGERELESFMLMRAKNFPPLCAKSLYAWNS